MPTPPRRAMLLLAILPPLAIGLAAVGLLAAAPRAPLAAETLSPVTLASADPPAEDAPGDADDPAPPGNGSTGTDGDDAESPDDDDADRDDAPPEPTEAARRTQVEIVLEGGRSVKGRLIEESERRVRAMVGGVEVSYDRSEIVELRTRDSVYQQYLDLREALPDASVDRRLMLVRWLLKRRAYRLALHETERVLAQDQANPEALRFRRHLAHQIELLERGDGSGDDAGDGDDARPPPDRGRLDEAFPRLAPEQINAIKVFELDLDDPPRIRIQRETIDDLIEEYADHELMPSSPEARRALYRKPAHKIVDLMFRLRARDLYSRIDVIGHPEAMRRFRDDIHRGWLLRGCATNRCHGGQAAGELWLYNRHPNSEATVYTNFLILERFRLDSGEPLIRYDEPAKSPLLQMALPRARSSHPHPEVTELGREVPYRPPLTSRDSDGFRNAIRWINAMYQPRPEYPIDYTPPVPAGVIEQLEQRPEGRQSR